MFKFIDKLFDTNKAELKKLSPLVEQINSLESKFKKFETEEFAAYLSKLKKQLSSQSLDDILPEVFALVREASVRQINMRPFDVQLMAGIVLHQGKIAEQKTGEGKTLAAVPALVLNALSGRGAHLVTVNDYLAQRDAGWMAPIYDLLGLSVAVIYSGTGNLPASIYDLEYSNSVHEDERLRHLKPISRPEAYKADITYGTNNEFGFDYLRDNMAREKQNVSQRDHHFAIVDEVDSILVDEARTPLIISAPDMEATDKYYRFDELIKKLTPKTDYEIDEKMGTANLTDYGLKRVEKLLNIENLYETDYDTLHHIEQALKAHALFIKNKEYIIKDDQIIIVDEHTGRLMYGRRYSDGLHQAIEAKEKVKIQQESRTLATISLQNYFRMYEKLSGMTGTAETEKTEFQKIYGLGVVVVPTNRPTIRKDRPDIVYKTQSAKYTAVVADVVSCHQSGQPVLIGTKSIEQNQIISKLLKHKKIPHQVLNAKNHEQEASIISQAGSLKAVTVATNIAGRGVDIVLGGDPEGKKKEIWQKEHDAVIRAGGLHIIGAVRHESRRIDNQFRGRSGRQGDPGSSRFYISLEDDIMRIFGGEQISRLMDLLKVPEDQPLEAGMVSRAIETAQSKVESFHFDQRKRVVEYDDVVNRQREIFYKRRHKILASQDTKAGIKKQIDNLLQQEVQKIVNIYSPSGIDKDEAKRIVQELQLILPLNSDSAKSLRQKIENQDPERVTGVLVEIIDKARANQKQILSDALTQVEMQLALATYDEAWMQHLDQLDNLREGIGLRGYAQKDPLVEYRGEAYNLFESLLSRIDTRIAERIFRIQPASIQVPVVNPAAVVEQSHKDQQVQDPNQNANLQTSNKTSSDRKLGRNDPCWCRSGKKFKKCHINSVPQSGQEKYLFDLYETDHKKWEEEVKKLKG